METSTLPHVQALYKNKFSQTLFCSGTMAESWVCATQAYCDWFKGNTNMPKFFLKQNADGCNQTQSISKIVCALHFVKVWSLMKRGPLFSLTPFQFCLRLASVVKIHEYSQENEKALR